MEHYYHIFANGDDARNFITSIKDFEAAFNRFAICAALCPNVHNLAFSIEDSHIHSLVSGQFEDVVSYKKLYETLTYAYIIATRGNKDGVLFELETLEINDESHLLNTAAYVLVQPTKDGKKVLPMDYFWGTASMYFRPEGYPPLWTFDSNWQIQPCSTIDSLSTRTLKTTTHSKFTLPEHWLVCNGLVLPSNYIEVEEFEKIFGSYNRYRTFLAAGNKQLQIVKDNMAKIRGVSLEDYEARQLSRSISEKLFGKKDSRWLSPMQRLELAKEMRTRYNLTIRQIATLSRLPELEIRRYFR